jgi:hypothetical protein
MIKVEEKEINKAIDKAIEIIDRSKDQELTLLTLYEEGVKDALMWVLGETDNPLDEE